jgi:hypothetical protein
VSPRIRLYQSQDTPESPAFPGRFTAINLTTYTNAYWMGEVVSAVDTWLSGNGYSAIAYAEAGSDTETEWASYSPYTLDYLTKVAANDGHNPIVDFGDAGGCPTTAHSNGGTCNNGWTQGQVLDVSWEPSWALPLPEIYNQQGANGQQWYEIAKLSIADGYGVMFFYGELTQYNACLQRGGCTGTKNTPSAGWTDLYTDLWSDSATRPGAVMQWSDDIRYLG